MESAPKIRSSIAAHLLDAQLGAVAVHVLVDQQGLTCPDDLGSEAGTEWPRPRVFAKTIGELEHHRGSIEQRHISNGRVKQVSHLIADKLNQAVLIKLGGKRLGDAIDGDQLGGTFADLVLSLIDDQICARIV